MSTRNVSVAAVCIFIAVVVAYFLLPGKSARITSDAFAVATTAPEVVEARIAPDGWLEYRNTAYHFSLLYPQELAVSEHPEGGNAITITFQDVEKAEGFQIFIVPYGEAQVSEERFRQDEPSGIRKNLTNIVIDGATGAAFYSTNLALGDTREVWFVHKGFLYEVTTLKPLEAWFRDILQTWKFI